MGQISGINCAAHFDHQIFIKGEWRCACIINHHTIQPEISTTSHRPACVTAVANSGAQSDLWSLDKFFQAGFTMRDLQIKIYVSRDVKYMYLFYNTMLAIGI